MRINKILIHLLDFRDIVKASHLTPLGKKEKIADPEEAKKVIWNPIASDKEESFPNCKSEKKHFTEKESVESVYEKEAAHEKKHFTGKK